MWTRKELKTRAKAVFQLNYWKTVLVALVMAMLIGGGGNAASGFSGGMSSGVTSMIASRGQDGYQSDDDLFAEDDSDIDFDEGVLSASVDDSEIIGGADAPTGMFVGAVFIGVLVVIFLVIFAAALAIEILLLNPLSVGIHRFFVRNLQEKGQMSELVYSFDHSYLNSVKIMFFKGLYEFLWSLLLIIPGIVKSYEYRMIPYLLAEHPEMSKEEAFARSKEMMSGNKWKAFVLDLSFIPWRLLSAVTLGIVGIFYVNPYVFQTNAALYDALKRE